MEEILQQSAALLHNKQPGFHRFLHEKISWNDRLIGIKGARGTGKTTLLLQWLKTKDYQSGAAAYFSLDDIYFSSHSLKETLVAFHARGGKTVVLDEVHKYPEWAREIKNAYDFFPGLQVVFTGSSILDLSRQEADLSRRAVMYELPGLSYREFLAFQKGIHLPPVSLEQILTNQLMSFFPSEFRPLAHFAEYLQFGYYPFLLENKATSPLRLKQMVRTVVEYDMAEMKDFDLRNARKMLQLLSIIARQVPFKPNISSLSEKTGLHRSTIGNYLQFMEKAKLISLSYRSGISTSVLQKPEKIHFNNTSLLYAMGDFQSNQGSIRETFFLSQASVLFQVSIPEKGDFLLDDRYLFEVGGKDKTIRQIAGIPDSFAVKDQIEYGSGRFLPLWAFGFLY
jgi:predicted AAA+ superfamily ATPase